MEKPVTFKVRRQQIVGMLHLPDGAQAPVPAVVFLHGFRGNKQEPHRLFVKTARALSGAGIASLRFDFRGSGDSEGEFSTMTIGGEVEDAQAALRFIRRRGEIDPARIGLLGMSMGGLVASFVLRDDPAIKAASLWCPVADTSASVARNTTPDSDKQLEGMGFYDMGGWAIGRQFVQEILARRPLEAVVKSAAPVLLIHGTGDDTVPVEDTLAYEKALRKAGRKVVKRMIAGANHTYDSISWEMEVIFATLEWFTGSL